MSDCYLQKAVDVQGNRIRALASWSLRKKLILDVSETFLQAVLLDHGTHILTARLWCGFTTKSFAVAYMSSNSLKPKVRSTFVVSGIFVTFGSYCCRLSSSGNLLGQRRDKFTSLHSRCNSQPVSTAAGRTSNILWMIYPEL